MTLPTFLMIGAAKSGTTSLMSYLGQHPEVFVSSAKEPNYFALADRDLPPKGPVPPHVLQALLYNWSRTDRMAYEALFDRVGNARAVGEGSVRYLYFEDTPARVRAAIPDVRLVAVLRDPVSRLYSHYSMNRQIQIEPLSLTEALDAEEARIAAGWGWDWHYVRAGLYGEQLSRWLHHFPREQLAVFLYDDFVADPQGMFSEICRHIGVDPSFRPDMSRRGMVGRLPRNLWIDRCLNWPGPLRRALRARRFRRVTRPVLNRLNGWNSRPIPPLDPDLRQSLASRFREDTARLRKLLGRELPWH